MTARGNPATLLRLRAHAARRERRALAPAIAGVARPSAPPPPSVGKQAAAAVRPLADRPSRRLTTLKRTCRRPLYNTAASVRGGRELAEFASYSPFFLSPVIRGREAADAPIIGAANDDARRRAAYSRGTRAARAGGGPPGSDAA